MESFDFERYLNIRSAYHPVWLMSGKRVTFLTDITGIPQVWAVDNSGGWPDQLTFFQDKIWSLSVSPTGEELVCTRDIGGNERYQLFLVSSDGRQVSRLTQDDQATHHFGDWSHDGLKIAYVSNGRNGVHFDVYVRSLDEETPQIHYQSDGNYRVGCWSPDDDQLILVHEISSAQQALMLLDLKGGDVRQLTTAGEPASYWQTHWPVKNSIYLLSDQGRDNMGLARMDVESGELTYLAEYSWDIEALAVSKDAEILAYTVNVDGYSQLYFYHLPSGRVSQVTGVPEGVISDPVFSPDGDMLAVSVQSPRHNLNIWLVDVSSLACHQLTRSSLAGIPQDSLVSPELIHYPTFDGRSIPAFFYWPTGVEPPLPVILYVHGGPASQILPDFDPRFQFFLNKGYAILAPNVRGSSGYGKEYMALDDVRLRMDSVTDLKFAVEWLRASGVVDPQKIAIYGRSYGGFMVLAAVTSYPEHWAAAIDVVGIGNWVTFLENTGSWRRAHREREYGSLENDRDFLESISPIHRVDRIQASMLVIHGANDPRVPVTEAEQIVENLRDRDHPVEYLCYPDEGHKISKLKNRIDSFNKMADFLAQHF